MTSVTNDRLAPEIRHAAMVRDVREGLGSRPRTLPPKYFYDARGSALFDAITRLDEYYPTRAERSILTERAAEIASRTRARTLIELGSGTSDKTRLLLDALTAQGTLRRFVPLDVDPAVLEHAADQLRREHPGVAIEPVVADFEHDLGPLPDDGPRLIAFLGSTIGNFEPTERAAFLTRISSAMGPEDHFLLGTDLVKEADRLVRAYDDAAGVTAAFNRNVLRVLADELGADADPETFDHVAIWDDRREWIEMRLRSRRDQRVVVPGADLVIDLEQGEEIRTEISAKFRRSSVEAELAAAGLLMSAWWTDAPGDFALSLSERQRARGAEASARP